MSPLLIDVVEGRKIHFIIYHLFYCEFSLSPAMAKMVVQIASSFLKHLQISLGVIGLGGLLRGEELIHVIIDIRFSMLKQFP